MVTISSQPEFLRQLEAHLVRDQVLELRRGSNPREVSELFCGTSTSHPEVS